MKVKSHSFHYDEWWQDLGNVRCRRCNNLLLYKGFIPLNSKAMLELDRLGILDQETLEEGEAVSDNQDGTITDLRIVPAQSEHPSVTKEPEAKVRDTDNSIGGGAHFEITTHYSRSIQDNPHGKFGSITMAAQVTERFPGEADNKTVAEIIEGQAILVKQKVLTELGLPFEQNPETLCIMETFPGSTVVGQGGTRTLDTATEAAQQRQARDGGMELTHMMGNEAAYAAHEAAQLTDPPPQVATRAATAAQAAPVATRATMTAQPAGGAASELVGAGRGHAGTNKDQSWFWNHLLNNPDRWFYRANKPAPTLPDYVSLDFMTGDGQRHVGLWEVNNQGQPNCPDHATLLSTPNHAFAQQDPTARR